MRFTKQPNRWSCAAAALAAILDKPVHEVIEQLGHDGSEIVDANARFPGCYRGYPMEEIIECAFKNGVVLMKMAAFPHGTTTGENEFALWSEEYCHERIESYMKEYDMMLTGPSQYGTKRWHVIAWDHVEQKFYDSSAPKPLEAATIDVVYFYLVLRLNSMQI